MSRVLRRMSLHSGHAGKDLLSNAVGLGQLGLHLLGQLPAFPRVANVMHWIADESLAVLLAQRMHQMPRL